MARQSLPLVLPTTKRTAEDQQYQQQVQQVVRAIAQFGTTTERPTTNLFVGRPFFDTSLNTQVIWNGSTWVGASGTVAGTGTTTGTTLNNEVLTVNTNGIITVTGSAGQIVVSGTSPTINIGISNSYVGQGSITTLGTIATGTWQGTPVGIAYGGTGTSSPALVAGSGINITGSWPNQTIASNVTGTVTSVGVSSSGTYAGAITVGSTPVTTSGTITLTPNLFTSSTPGIVPLSGGGTTNYLRADGTWAAPSGGGGGSFSATVISHSSTYTESNTSGYVISLTDATSGNIVANLPSASSSTGFVYTVKKINSNSNIITVTANGSDKIDGNSTATLTTQYQSITIVSNGTNWSII